MENAWNLVVAIMISFGGAGGIIWAVVKWCGDILADKLSQKYAHQLEGELEKYRVLLDKKKYIGNKRFDLEFSIYRELSGGIIDMTEAIYFLFPTLDFVPEKEEEKRKVFIERYKLAIRSYNKTSKIIMKNAAFIPVSFYEKCINLRRLCSIQMTNAKIFIIDEDCNKNIDAMYQDFRESWKNSQKLLELRDAFMQDLRIYLQTLEEIKQ